MDTSSLNIKSSEAIAEKRAAFVTLKRSSRLRGCIGDLVPRRELYQSVIINAVNAGFFDRRFTPLEKSEYDKKGAKDFITCCFQENVLFIKP